MKHTEWTHTVQETRETQRMDTYSIGNKRNIENGHWTHKVQETNETYSLGNKRNI